MSKGKSLYGLNDDEMLENKQSGVKVTARVLKGYILNGENNKYDGEWYLVDNGRFRSFDLLNKIWILLTNMIFLYHSILSKKILKNEVFYKMIKNLVKSWENHKHELEMDILANEKEYRHAEYDNLVEKLVHFIFNTEEMLGDANWYEYDMNHDNTIDDGDYQGTRIFFVNRDSYQPSETDYIVTFVNYGSCSACDTLQGAQSCDLEMMKDDLMTLFLHMIQKAKYLYD